MSSRTFALILILGLGIAIGQAHADPSNFVFRGGPADSCKSFALFETGVVYRAVGSATYGYSNRTMLMVDLGYMRNISNRWALGGSGHVNLNGDGAKVGLRGRARYWFTPKVGLDLMSGVIVYGNYDHEKMNGPGLTLGLSLTFEELLSFDAYLESIPIEDHAFRRDGVQPELYYYKAQRTGLYLGATGRSYAGAAFLAGCVLFVLIFAHTVHVDY